MVARRRDCGSGKLVCGRNENRRHGGAMVENFRSGWKVTKSTGMRFFSLKTFILFNTCGGCLE
jgi:hypothetical protein